jgi:hypothetical protein
MPLWAWGLLVAYLSLLLLAGLWAEVRRMRSAWKRSRQVAHAEPLEQ